MEAFSINQWGMCNKTRRPLCEGLVPSLRGARRTSECAEGAARGNQSYSGIWGMNSKERLARLGLYNSETRIVELSSLLRHGDTELGAQGNNSLSELLDRLAGRSTMKDLEGEAPSPCPEADPGSMCGI